jgi:K+ transporter
LPLFNEHALKIVDCLRAKPDDDDIHGEETRRLGPAQRPGDETRRLGPAPRPGRAPSPGATGVVYGGIGTAPISAFHALFRAALRATGAAVPGAPEVLGIRPALSTSALPITLGIRMALFFVQRQGTARVARPFGRICGALWLVPSFGSLAASAWLARLRPA